MLSCKDITKEASNYLDSKLSFSQRISFKMHLFMCVHCRLYVHQLKTTITTLAGMKPEKIANSEVEKVISMLKQQESVQGKSGNTE